MVAAVTTEATVATKAEALQLPAVPPSSISINISGNCSDSGNGSDVLQQQQQQLLENRVMALELKLATLSRILQQQQKQRRRQSPPSPPALSPSSPTPRPLLHASSQDCIPDPDPDSPLPYHHHNQQHHNQHESYKTSSHRRTLSSKILLDDGDLTDTGTADATNNTAADASNNDTTTNNEPDHTTTYPTTTTTTTPNYQAKWLEYLNSFQEATPDVDLQMEEFVRVPSQVESLLTFGMIICFDCYLYTITILPLRAVWSLMLLLLTFTTPQHRRRPEYQFHRRHLYPLIQVSIIYSIYKFILVPISIGKLYHWIRGQAMLKLYVCIAIVEVLDRLMCSMGQDCLDSMYWNTTKQPTSRRMVVSSMVVLVYATCHALILFVHVATLNVAMNSSDQALLTLLISGNFAEIKSTVFKKYNKPNLFKIAAADICERFKLALFLTLVLVLNMSQGMDTTSQTQYMFMCGIVWCAEVLADWLKHSFITKFNFIRSTVYPEYALLLAGDVTGIGHEGVNLDRSHAVVKRIGFAQLPLVCVMLRFVKEGLRYYASPGHEYYMLLCLCMAWLVMFGIKLALGKWLQRHCLAKLEAAPELTKSSTYSPRKVTKRD